MSGILRSLLVVLHNQGLPHKDRKRSALLFVAWKYYITGEQIHMVQMLQSGPSGQATLDWNNIPPNHTGENPCGRPRPKTQLSGSGDYFLLNSTSFLLFVQLLLLPCDAATQKVFKNLTKLYFDSEKSKMIIWS